MLYVFWDFVQLTKITKVWTHFKIRKLLIEKVSLCVTQRLKFGDFYYFTWIKCNGNKCSLILIGHKQTMSWSLWFWWLYLKHYHDRESIMRNMYFFCIIIVQIELIDNHKSDIYYDLCFNFNQDIFPNKNLSWNIWRLYLKW